MSLTVHTNVTLLNDATEVTVKIETFSFRLVVDKRYRQNSVLTPNMEIANQVAAALANSIYDKVAMKVKDKLEKS